jgi:hypothetical protein
MIWEWGTAGLMEGVAAHPTVASEYDFIYLYYFFLTVLKPSLL